MKKYIESGRIKFKEKYTKTQRGFIFKRYAGTMEVKNMPVDSLLFASNEFMNSVATSELKAILNTSKFNYPKPITFISQIVKSVSARNSIVLDFFAGVRVIIMTQANSQVNTRILEFLPKFKIKK